MNDVLSVLRSRAVLHAPPGRPFVLKSGATSMHYVDVRLAALSHEGITVLSRALASRIGSVSRSSASRVAGVALGGCPLATAVGLVTGRDVLYVRPEPKSHGTGKLVEGSYAPGDAVVLLEDVITSGGSTLKAIFALRDSGLQVEGVVAVLDREQGGAALIEKECRFASLLTLKELLEP